MYCRITRGSLTEKSELQEGQEITHILENIRSYLVKIESVIAAASLLLLLLLSMVQVLARNFFDMGFPDLDVIMRYLILFVSFLGAILATERNTHIKIDIVSSLLREELRQKLMRPIFFLSALVCMAFFWYSTLFWLDEWEFAPVMKNGPHLLR